MTQLHQALAARVAEWRGQGYPCPDYPAVAETLEWSLDPETGNLRYLRRPQLQALEVYWYLRLVEGTPRTFALYRTLFSNQLQLIRALGIDQEPVRNYLLEGRTFDELIQRIRTDDDFVRDLRLEALRETLTLDYASYILALAMGAGKTVLIGAIIATEFAMALEYPDGRSRGAAANLRRHRARQVARHGHRPEGLAQTPVLRLPALPGLATRRARGQVRARRGGVLGAQAPLLEAQEERFRVLALTVAHGCLSGAATDLRGWAH